MGKHGIQDGKKHSYPSARKSYSTTRKGIGGRKKLKKNIDQEMPKSTALTRYFTPLVSQPNHGKEDETSTSLGEDCPFFCFRCRRSTSTFISKMLFLLKSCLAIDWFIKILCLINSYCFRN